jgi:hypothetical protein
LIKSQSDNHLIQEESARTAYALNSEIAQLKDSCAELKQKLDAKCQELAKSEAAAKTDIELLNNEIASHKQIIENAENDLKFKQQEHSKVINEYCSEIQALNATVDKN